MYSETVSIFAVSSQRLVKLLGVGDNVGAVLRMVVTTHVHSVALFGCGWPCPANRARLPCFPARLA